MLFVRICANEDKIYNTFMFIKKHLDFGEYLIALHYHRELRYYAEHPEENIADDSILDCLYGYQSFVSFQIVNCI